MKMLIKSSFVLLIVIVCQTTSREITCDIIPLKTESALMGYCCILARNISDIESHKEEIKEHLLDNFINDTIDDIFRSEVSSAENKDFRGKAVTSGIKINDSIKFPGATSADKIQNVSSEQNTNIASEQNKNITSTESNLSAREAVTESENEKKLGSDVTVQTKNVDQTKSNSGNRVINKTQAAISENKNNSSSHIIPIIPVNRNAVDIPETCPDGSEKDHNGECVPVF